LPSSSSSSCPWSRPRSYAVSAAVVFGFRRFFVFGFSCRFYSGLLSAFRFPVSTWNFVNAWPCSRSSACKLIWIILNSPTLLVLYTRRRRIGNQTGKNIFPFDKRSALYNFFFFYENY
jgi:hypothetical protein